MASLMKKICSYALLGLNEVCELSVKWLFKSPWHALKICGSSIIRNTVTIMAECGEDKCGGNKLPFHNGEYYPPIPVIYAIHLLSTDFGGLFPPVFLQCKRISCSCELEWDFHSQERIQNCLQYLGSTPPCRHDTCELHTIFTMTKKEPAVAILFTDLSRKWQQRLPPIL